MLEIGDKLRARYSDKLGDKVTKGKVYEVSDIELNRYTGEQIFRIKNDEGKTVMPIWVKFEKVNN